MRLKILIIFLTFTLFVHAKPKRTGKVFSLFNIVTFENAICTTANDGRKGTCYTGSECVSRRGSPSGSCASGFGVCCLFLASTTSTLYQNCTYLRNQGFPSGFNGAASTVFTIQKCSSGVCSIRLDFETFSISGPSRTDEEDGGLCDTESLTIVSSTSKPFPTICGENSGKHVYVDLGGMSSDTATLTFTLSKVTSSFEIKVSQIPCGSNYTPPANCFQYFTATQGTISTFNFMDTKSSHLQNQRYTTCIRRALGMCCVEYMSCPDDNSMTLFSKLPMGSNGEKPHNAIDSFCSEDYVVIQGASAQCTCSVTGRLVSRFCGRVLNTEVSTVGNATSDVGNIPICDCLEPFEIHIVTDASSEENSATLANRGFCVNYRQRPC